MLHFVRAYNFYNILLNDQKQKIYKKRGFRYTISSDEWEVFIAELRDTSKGENRQDLIECEVKSARFKNHYKWDFYSNTGLIKLKKATTTEHIFIGYGNNYHDVQVYIIRGEELTPILKKWKRDLLKTFKRYKGKGQVRYQTAIPTEWVQTNGILVMEIKGKELVYTININNPRQIGHPDLHEIAF